MIRRGGTLVRVVLAGLLCAMAVAVGTSPAPATEAANAAIRGVVRVNGTPLAGATVTAKLGAATVKTTSTSATGTYAFTALVAGGYVLTADGPTIGPAVTSVNVPPGANVTGVIINAQRSGAVTGKITGPNGAAAVATVSAHRTGTFEELARTTSRAGDGWYRLGDLPSGPVLLKAENASGTAWFTNATSAAGATAVNVPAGGTAAGKSMRINGGGGGSGGSISGRLTTSTGQGADGSVKVYRAGSASDFVGAFPTADGAWTTGPLGAGSYLLLFTSPGETSEWWRDADTLDRALPVVVGSGAVTGIDAQLEARSRVSGTVRDAFGEMVSNATIVLYRAGTSNVVAVGTTGLFGVATIEGVRTGNYELEARPPSGSPQRASLRVPVQVNAPMAANAQASLRFPPGTGGYEVMAVESHGVYGTGTSAVGTVTTFKVTSTGGLSQVRVDPLTQWYTQIVGLPAGTYTFRIDANLVANGAQVRQWAGEAATRTAAYRFQVGPSVTGMRLVEYVGEPFGHLIHQLASSQPGVIGRLQLFRRGTSTLVAELPAMVGGPLEWVVDPGTYDLKFVPSVPGLVASWYPGVANQSAATAVVVPAEYSVRLAVWNLG